MNGGGGCTVSLPVCYFSPRVSNMASTFCGLLFRANVEGNLGRVVGINSGGGGSLNRDKVDWHVNNYRLNIIGLEQSTEETQERHRSRPPWWPFDLTRKIP